MLNIDIAKLEKSVADLQALLRDGLLATDIWDPATGLSLAGINPQPAATALFNVLTTDIGTTLVNSGFPPLNRYYLLDLGNNNAVVILKHGEDLLQGILLDSRKANMGILFSVALPKALDAVQKARVA
ncbi:MAG: hypothetical protein LC098_11770 [Burkholderiales bacterium]|nr:hypothetical protein [Pseudomonadota bacterium]MCZ2136085.1 hypothetical protein [Burkholderiales bacterium]